MFLILIYLQVGGIKEKVLAAYRAGIRYVIMPKKNENDLREILTSVQVCKLSTFIHNYIHSYISLSQAELEFIFVSTVDDVLQHAFDVGMKACITSKL